MGVIRSGFDKIWLMKIHGILFLGPLATDPVDHQIAWRNMEGRGQGPKAIELLQLVTRFIQRGTNLLIRCNVGQIQELAKLAAPVNCGHEAVPGPDV